MLMLLMCTHVMCTHPINKNVVSALLILMLIHMLMRLLLVISCVLERPLYFNVVRAHALAPYIHPKH